MIEQRILCGLLFEYASEFYKDAHNHLRVNVKDKFKDTRYVIYIHYYKEHLIYIGETSEPFEKRMRYYCNHNGVTNQRVRSYIKDTFTSGPDKVHTFVHKPNKLITINEELLINPYVAIEQALISKFNPPLNRKNVYK